MNPRALKITLLGTGTSQGVPVMGCSCAVCLSDHPKDNRLRTAVLVESAAATVVIDCGPDFRQQMLRENVQRLNAVLLTHEHQDHVAGLDDLRSYIFKQNISMPILAEERVLTRIKTMLPYAFVENPYPGSPKFDLQEIKPGNIKSEGFHFQALRLMHGKLPILGYRINNFAYLTDVNFIPEKTLLQLKELDVLVLDALHHRAHHSHFNLQEAIAVAQQIGAQKTYFTHISHNMGLQQEVDATLPESMSLAFDGLTFEV